MSVLRREHDVSGPRVRRSSVRPRRTVRAAIRRLPAYLRLLGRLMRDARVSRLDRFLVVATIAYVINPFDFLPDVIPFVGQIDDVFLLVIALTRLVEQAGRDVLLDNWDGAPEELDRAWLRKVAWAASFFLPVGTRRRLRRFAHAR
jgi:uncharacterized membrane protein YkvA (DUF1232 family)